MIERNTATKSRELHVTDPLLTVPESLEKLGLTSDGEFHFDISHIEPAGDILTLIKDGDECAIALYAKPIETGITLGGEQYLIIRNQTITYLEDGVIAVATGDATILGERAPLPIGMELTTSDDADENFFKLLDYVAVLVSCVRLEDQLSAEQVRRKLNQPE